MPRKRRRLNRPKDEQPNGGRQFAASPQIALPLLCAYNPNVLPAAKLSRPPRRSENFLARWYLREQGRRRSHARHHLLLGETGRVRKSGDIVAFRRCPAAAGIRSR